MLLSLGFGRGRSPWLINATAVVIGLALTIMMFGEGLGITANAEAPTGAQSTAAVTGFKLASPVGLREARTPRIEGGVPLSIPVSVERGYPFVWPVTGPITSYMGPGHPLGIDIGLDKPYDEPIASIAAGTVTFAGGSDLHDYGYYAIVDHGNGITSLYAHLERHLVREGEQVAQGQSIGIGGSTGKSSGKHLHLEVLIHGSRVDPLTILPTMGQQAETLEFDCMEAGLMIDAGSQARFDFERAVAGGTILGVEVKGVSGQEPPLQAQAVTPTSVHMATPLDIAGPAREDGYNLVVSVETQGERRELDCELTVRVTPAATAFYVRAAEPMPTVAAEDYQPEPPAPEPEPTDEPVDEERVEEEEPTPEPTLEIPDIPILGTVEPTATPEATATLEPTATPEATATLEPTATPAPSATPEPTPRPAATTTSR